MHCLKEKKQEAGLTLVEWFPVDVQQPASQNQGRNPAPKGSQAFQPSWPASCRQWQRTLGCSLSELEAYPIATGLFGTALTLSPSLTAAKTFSLSRKTPAPGLLS